MAETTNLPAIKDFFSADTVKSKIGELLGKRSTSFISTILQVVNNNSLLAKADPVSIYQAASMAAVLGLEINPTLGQAWLVPYSGKCQFQIGYKGLVQLAHRSGEYKKINVKEVYANQFRSWNGLFEVLEADFSIDGEGAPIGYVAWFQLKNGFEKVSYWTHKAVSVHGKKYSRSFDNGPWKTNFDAMAKKTVLKDALVHWGILSVEMVKAIEMDQAIINDDGNPDYQDNPTTDAHWTDATNEEKISEEFKRSCEFLQSCDSRLALSNLQTKIPTERFSESEKIEWTKRFHEKFNALT